MLLLLRPEEIDSIYLEYIKQISHERKVYVVSKSLYLYFRYELKINVDIACLRSNHIYTCMGEKDDSMQVFCFDLERELEQYGFDCDIAKFQELHTVSYSLEDCEF